MLKGNIEVANPTELSGWAQNEAHPDVPVRLQIINNGMRVGTVTADRYRFDLEQAGVGNGRHAFRFDFPAGIVSSELHVVRVLQDSNGAELPGSPVTLRASKFFETVGQALVGSVEFVSLNLITGWGRDELRPEKVVSFTISDNGEPIGHVVADSYREDLKEAGIGTGRHAFEFSVSLDPSITHVIRVRRDSDGKEIQGSPSTLNPIQPREHSEQLLGGSIDAISLSRVSGWARDLLQPTNPISLMITVNDELVGRLLANSYREDLKQAGIGNGRFAFFFEFPSPLAPFKDNVIRVIREIDGADIPGSPATLRMSRSFDSETEESLARALNQCGSMEDLPRKIEFLAGQIDILLQQNADAESLRANRDRYRRLVQRWKSEPPQNVASIAASNQEVLRALVIDERLPKPGRDAGSDAVLSHILSLQRLGYEVTVVPALNFNPSPADRAAIEALGVKCCHAPYYGSVEEVLRRQSGEFDVVYLHRIPNASKYGELVTTYFPKARRIYSVADLYHVRVLRQAQVEDRPELVALGKRLRLAEFTATAFSNAVIAHSKSETDLLKSAVPGAAVFTIPWSVKSRPTKVPFAKRKGIAFIGGFGHAPNQDAVRWLIKDIMPLVRSQDPKIDCYLVGSDMPEQFRLIQADGIVPIGYVDDLNEIFDRIRLTVAPLAYGAGLKGKVIDSLAAGIPCVCTKVAAEGFDWPALLHSCIADDPVEIATAIVRLHNKKAENELCRNAGLEFVTGEFSEERLDALMREVVQMPRKAAGPSQRENTVEIQRQSKREISAPPELTKQAKPVAARTKRARAPRVK